MGMIKNYLQYMFCRKKRLYLRQQTTYINMQDIEDKIYNKDKKCGRGIIFSSSDFTRYGEPKSVLKSLERMAASGTIIRVARGFFCYP